MLIIAWTMAPLSALPQTFIFQLKKHPLKTDYWQCTTIGYFESHTMVRLFLTMLNLIVFFPKEFLYFIFVSTLTWLLPLLVMLGSYLTIIVIIYRSSKMLNGGNGNLSQRSTEGVIGKVKIRTIKITGVLVIHCRICDLLDAIQCNVPLVLMFINPTY